VNAFVVTAPLAAALLPLLLPAGTPRRCARIVLAAGAALAPLLLADMLDRVALALVLLVSLLAFLAVAFSTGRGFFSRLDGDRVGEPTAPVWSRVSVYFALLGAFWSAMLLVATATTFSGLWLGISATTLATAFLVAFAGESLALEAAWKYLILCSVGIAVALAGMLLLAHVTLAAGVAPSAALSWDAIGGRAFAAAPAGARLAVALMLVGFATKAGLVPMHAWLPDAHSKAPAPVSGLLSGVLVSCALYALWRTVQVATALGCGPFARETLLWFGAVSIVVAALLMLVQTDLKRLLAYSTVEHAGIAALALGFGTPLGDLAALFHVLAHGTTKAAAFFAVGLVQRAAGTTAIGELHGLWRAGAAGRLLLGALGALGAMPPFGVFASELLVVVAGALAGRWAALAIGVVGMAIAFSALARTAIAVEAGAAPTARPLTSAGLRFVSTGAAVLALGCALATVLLPWSAFAR
jgi:hydrogenase-4 component F